jgi:hypothetical protein
MTASMARTAMVLLGGRCLRPPNLIAPVGDPRLSRHRIRLASSTSAPAMPSTRHTSSPRSAGRPDRRPRSLPRSPVPRLHWMRSPCAVDAMCRELDRVGTPSSPVACGRFGDRAVVVHERFAVVSDAIHAARRAISASREAVGSPSSDRRRAETQRSVWCPRPDGRLHLPTLTSAIDLPSGRTQPHDGRVLIQTARSRAAARYARARSAQLRLA